MALETFSTEKVSKLLGTFIHEKRSDSENNIRDNINHSNGIGKATDWNAFQSRLKSFSSLNWFAKPIWLSPPICARYGWHNVEKDVLQCVTCKAFFNGRLPSTLKPQTYQDCCKRLQKLLLAAHHRYCSWPNNPSPEKFLEVQSKQLNEIEQDLLNLLQMGTALPEIMQNVWEKMNLNKEVYEYLRQRVGGDESYDEHVFESACALIIGGWTLKSKSSTNSVICCDYCKREAGLWNYSRLSGDDAENSDEEDDGEPCRKQSCSHDVTTDISTEAAPADQEEQNDENQSETEQTADKELGANSEGEVSSAQPQNHDSNITNASVSNSSDVSNSSAQCATNVTESNNVCETVQEVLNEITDTIVKSIDTGGCDEIGVDTKESDTEVDNLLPETTESNIKQMETDEISNSVSATESGPEKSSDETAAGESGNDDITTALTTDVIPSPNITSTPKIKVSPSKEISHSPHTTSPLKPEVTSQQEKLEQQVMRIFMAKQKQQTIESQPEASSNTSVGTSPPTETASIEDSSQQQEVTPLELSNIEQPRGTDFISDEEELYVSEILDELPEADVIFDNDTSSDDDIVVQYASDNSNNNNGFIGLNGGGDGSSDDDDDNAVEEIDLEAISDGDDTDGDDDDDGLEVDSNDDLSITLDDESIDIEEDTTQEEESTLDNTSNQDVVEVACIEDEEEDDDEVLIGNDEQGYVVDSENDEEVHDEIDLNSGDDEDEELDADDEQAPNEEQLEVYDSEDEDDEEEDESESKQSYSLSSNTNQHNNPNASILVIDSSSEEEDEYESEEEDDAEEVVLDADNVNDIGDEHAIDSDVEEFELESENDDDDNVDKNMSDDGSSLVQDLDQSDSVQEIFENTKQTSVDKNSDTTIGQQVTVDVEARPAHGDHYNKNCKDKDKDLVADDVTDLGTEDATDLCASDFTDLEAGDVTDLGNIDASDLGLADVADLVSEGVADVGAGDVTDGMCLSDQQIDLDDLNVEVAISTTDDHRSNSSRDQHSKSNEENHDDAMDVTDTTHDDTAAETSVENVTIRALNEQQHSSSDCVATDDTADDDIDIETTSERDVNNELLINRQDNFRFQKLDRSSDCNADVDVVGVTEIDNKTVESMSTESVNSKDEQHPDSTTDSSCFNQLPSFAGTRAIFDQGCGGDSISSNDSGNGRHTPFTRVDSSMQLAFNDVPSAVSSPDGRFSETPASPSTSGADVTATCSPQDNKRKRKLGKNPMDPLAEHRNWCPWITCLSSIRGDRGKDNSEVGWQTLLQLLLHDTAATKHNLQTVVRSTNTSPGRAAERRLRGLFDGWTSTRVTVTNQ